MVVELIDIESDAIARTKCCSKNCLLLNTNDFRHTLLCIRQNLIDMSGFKRILKKEYLL